MNLAAASGKGDFRMSSFPLILMCSEDALRELTPGIKFDSHNICGVEKRESIHLQRQSARLEHNSMYCRNDRRVVTN